VLKSYSVEDLHIDTIGGIGVVTILNLTWSGVINLNTRIFVSATEFNRANGEALVGSANYTVFNVAPYNGGVRVWVNINWSSDIPIRLDYLIINP
jgi:hypothetical protein